MDNSGVVSGRFSLQQVLPRLEALNLESLTRKNVILLPQFCRQNKLTFAGDLCFHELKDIVLLSTGQHLDGKRGRLPERGLSFRNTQALASLAALSYGCTAPVVGRS